MNKDIVVAVLGASPKPERYSHKAVVMLLEHGYQVVPVNPGGMEICDIQAVTGLGEIPVPVDTLTVYVNPGISSGMADQIRALKPRRIIFNPGTETPGLADSCRENGIEVEEACTLVLLQTGQF